MQNINFLFDASIIVIGWIVSYIFRDIISSRLDEIVFKINKSYINRFGSPEGKIIELPGKVVGTVRYILDMESIGSLMLRQYGENAEQIIVYVGDCNFLDVSGSERLIDRFYSLADHSKLEFRTRYDLIFFEKKYNIKGDTRKKRIYSLTKKLNDQKKFTVIGDDNGYRGSFVDYGSQFSIFSYHGLNPSGDDIYPAAVVSISSATKIQFGTTQIEIAPMLQKIASDNLTA